MPLLSQSFCERAQSVLVDLEVVALEQPHQVVQQVQNLDLLVHRLDEGRVVLDFGERLERLLLQHEFQLVITLVQLIGRQGVEHLDRRVYAQRHKLELLLEVARTQYGLLPEDLEHQGSVLFVETGRQVLVRQHFLQQSQR